MRVERCCPIHLLEHLMREYSLRSAGAEHTVVDADDARRVLIDGGKVV